MWAHNGDKIIALLQVTPTECAIENSKITAHQEEENRKTLYNLGFDLQNLSDEFLHNSFKDGYYMVAVKKAFESGKYSLNKTLDSSTCSTKSNESVAAPSKVGVRTSVYAVPCSIDLVSHSLIILSFHILF